MSMMTMGVEARDLKRGDHVLGTVAGDVFTGLVTLVDDASIDDVALVRFNVIDDEGVLWDFFESAETVMVAVVWTEEGDE